MKIKWMACLSGLLITFLLLGSTGCSSDSDGGGDSIVGSWRATAFNGLPMPAGVAMAVTFRNNGTYVATTTYEGITATETGTWSTSNGILTTTFAGGTEQVAYSVSGNTMTTTDPEGTFTLRRQ